MAQVNHGESDMMATEKVDIFAIITEQQSPKLVDPSETAFTSEALLVNKGIEQPFTPALDSLALVLGDVGDKALIETDFAGRTGIESTVGIEQRPGDDQPQAFHHFESGLKVGFQTKSVVMIARHDPRRSNDKTVGIGDGQDIARFGPLAMLVSHALTALLGQRMATIEVQVG